MLHVVHFNDALELRILQENAGREGARDRDVDVLVDGSGEKVATVIAVVRRQVCAASTKGDPERTAGDDHVADAS